MKRTDNYNNYIEKMNWLKKEIEKIKPSNKSKKELAYIGISYTVRNFIFFKYYPLKCPFGKTKFNSKKFAK